jgi:hypothetical protein
LDFNCVIDPIYDLSLSLILKSFNNGVYTYEKNISNAINGEDKPAI